MDNVKVEARHYEEAIKQLRKLPCLSEATAIEILDEIKQRARYIAQAEQEKKK